MSLYQRIRDLKSGSSLRWMDPNYQEIKQRQSEAEQINRANERRLTRYERGQKFFTFEEEEEIEDHAEGGGEKEAIPGQPGNDHGSSDDPAQAVLPGEGEGGD